RHDVGEGIIVDILMIFIWPNDAANVALPIRLQHGAARPKASGLEKNLGASILQKSFIASRLPVLPNGVSYVCADMLFLLSGQNFNDLAIWSDHLFRRHFGAGTR